VSSPAVIAHLEQLNAYYDDPTAAPHTDPPPPPSPEVAAELCAATAQLLAYIIEYRRSGQLPDREPSVQTRLDVADLLDRYLEVRE
jgi:hypothetical protein